MRKAEMFIILFKNVLRLPCELFDFFPIRPVFSLQISGQGDEFYNPTGGTVCSET